MSRRVSRQCWPAPLRRQTLCSVPGASAQHRTTTRANALPPPWAVEGLATLAALDPRLAAIEPAAGPLPWRVRQPGFPGLLRAICGQQNSNQAAAAIWRRLAALPGALFARMSGSGATCFALFAKEAEAQDAAEALRQARPGWWVASGLVYPGRADMAQVIRDTT